MFGASFCDREAIDQVGRGGRHITWNEPLSKATYCPLALMLGKSAPTAALLVPA